MNQRGFGEFIALRERLSAAMAELADTLRGLGADERAQRLLAAREALERDTFRLMVVGEFKRGKSTLINAMLGADVLPAKIAPCTAVVTEVRHGEVPRAVLHFEAEDRPPLEVPVSELKRYVTIDLEDADDEEAQEAVAKSPYARMELQYPLALLENNVEIIDSPGLNEHRTRTKLALDYMAGADALVLVLSCQQALAMSELSFIDRELGGRNLRHVFFVWNHHDAVAGSEAEMADLRRRSSEYLAPRIGSDTRIFYLSAKQALTGRKAGDAAAIEASGLSHFEAELERFLATERGQVKLLTPLRMAESAVREAFMDIVPRREALLAQPAQELAARYEAQKPRIEELERRRERLLHGVERRRDALSAATIAAYQAFVAQLEPELRDEASRIDVGIWQAITGRRQAQQAVGQRLQTWLDARVRRWQQEVLDPLFEAHQRELLAEVEQHSQAYFESLDAIRTALAPELRVAPAAQAQDVAAADRLLSAVGGFFIGGVGAAIEGAGFGFKGLSRGLIVHLGAWVALAACGLGMPVIFPILLTLGLGRSVWEANQLANRLREQVVRDFTTQLRDGIPQVSQETHRRIGQGFDTLNTALDAAMATLTDEVVGQVRQALEAKEQGEAQLRAALDGLAEQKEALTAAGRRLEALRFELETGALAEAARS